jgi:hypothetical protein
MDHDELTGALIQHILVEAKSRSDAVRRGAETPRLAALLLHKFGRGAIGAFSIASDESSAVRAASNVLDSELVRLDPSWRANDRQRWAACPADLALR